MTPDDLRTALAAAKGPAASTALDVLEDPRATIHADREVQGTTANLLTVYRRRADHVSAIGLPTIGFEEVVADLEEASHSSLRLAIVEGASGYPSCVIFLAPDSDDVITAVAVLAPLAGT